LDQADEWRRKLEEFDQPKTEARGSTPTTKQP